MMSETQSTTSAPRSDQDVIETLRAYNRTQLKKIADMENVTLSSNNDDDITTLNDRSQIEMTATLKQFPIYYDWVQTLLKYNNELIEIVEQNGKWNDNIHSGERKPVDINNSNDNDPNLRAENAELMKRIHKLEQQKQSLEEAAMEARVLVLEVAERHDIIVKLKNELNEMEQLLMQKDTHIQFKDEIIRELRQQRRGNFKCPHNLIGKTKLNSIDKVVDLIRTVSRDISPDSSKDCCDCTVDSCHEKENQTDETIARNINKNSQTDKDDYLVKIEAQQTEIDQLRNELEKTKSNYDRVYKSYNTLNQQLDSITSLHSENPESQVFRQTNRFIDYRSISSINSSIQMTCNGMS